MSKKYNIAVKVGTYLGEGRVEKSRYSDLGAVHAGKERGNYFVVLNVSEMLYLAHKAISDGRDSVIASLFEPKDAGVLNDGKSHVVAESTPTASNFDDDVPF